MKRSEVLHMIRQTLIYGRKDQMVEDILFTIEKAGMTPPKYLKYEITKNNKEHFTNVRDWEPEDEN